MMYLIQNKKDKKIIKVQIIASESFSSLFKNPNFYGVFFFHNGECILTFEGKEKTISNQNVLFYYPYQQLHITGSFEGVCIQFHPDFFCIDIHAKDIVCQGLLFNNFMNDQILACSKEEYADVLDYYSKRIVSKRNWTIRYDI